jgi:plastocyanin
VNHRIHPVVATGRRAACAAAALLLALGPAACGGGSDDTDAEAEGTVATDSAQARSSSPGASAQTSSSAAEQQAGTITATEADFSITLDEDSLSAGTYEIQVVNEGGATHDLVVERDGEDVAATDAIDPGQTSTLTVTLEPGEYVFYCSVGNHRAMGMETTVVVT